MVRDEKIILTSWNMSRRSSFAATAPAKLRWGCGPQTWRKGGGKMRGYSGAKRQADDLVYVEVVRFKARHLTLILEELFCLLAERTS